ncbi:MAG: cysteine desulfurase [Oscillospiraceae bacterium]|nr:cysteine desulfurase [Oscillospiraceae bacterium]
MEHYLDNAATTRVCDEAAEAAVRAMTVTYGNPSSTHASGRNARALLDSSRKRIASALGCGQSELVFTSCGTESDNWAVIAGTESMRRKGLHVISSEAEHDAVRKSLDELERRGFEITRLKPDPSGSVSIDSLRSALRPDTVLVSLMLVNNETGSVTDISAAARAIKDAGSSALLHTDAVQAFLKVPFRAASLGADLISISGHKIHAPKGIGALYIRKGLRLKPYIIGGGQEDGRRAGTEALPQIAAFAAACDAAAAQFEEYSQRMYGFRDEIIRSVSSSVPSVTINGGGAPHILNISLPGLKSEVLMNYLEAREIYVSKSSACKKGGRSHVLEAMGVDPRSIDGSIRIGLSRYTTGEDVTALCEGIREAWKSLAHS